MDMTVLEILIFILASFRLTRLVVFDEITEPLRRPFFIEMMEQTENGETETFIVPKEKGVIGFLGRLLSCYWCTGFWVSVFWVLFYFFFPIMAEPLLLIFAIAGGAALVETVVQYLIKDNE
ncbi:DUF1360 domain-containing protein [Bacillus sp. FJAT-42315]|uniref:DUF1360 domain-containing protein n=1 Tax=Bacillus sp. FJAT-42315 TaxID=2014077 RepID=UPI000C23315A|nr:DUF1360 domain-containing protein [Bacillus sp. FJAT-42315]